MRFRRVLGFDAQRVAESEAALDRLRRGGVVEHLY